MLAGRVWLNTLTKKWAKPGLFFVYFRPFLNTITNIAQYLTINGISRDGVLGILTLDSRMVCADESTELWQPLKYIN